MQSEKQTIKDCHNPSPFIQKLQEILKDPSHFQIIHFNETEKQIEITSKKKLQKILGRYFRHARYESFIRQLNWYGFYKVNNQILHCYKHSNLENGLNILTIKSRRNTQSKRNKQESIHLSRQPAIVQHDVRNRNSDDQNQNGMNFVPNYMQNPIESVLVQNNMTNSGIAPQMSIQNFDWNASQMYLNWFPLNTNQMYSFYIPQLQ